MLKFEEALSEIRAAARERRGSALETVPLSEARGRVLAQAITSPETVPAFDNSAMDGFALASADVANASAQNPVRLKIRGSLAAGHAPLAADAWSNGSCFEIMTGAPVPTGCDAILKVEDAIVRDAELEVRMPLKPGQHVRPAGGDFQIGSPVARLGEVISPYHILALAGLGIAEVPVFRRPRVALIATGEELVDHRDTPRPGQIRNSTAPFFESALQALGVDFTFLGRVGDDPRDFARVVGSALEARYDLLLTTGAVSMGKHDFVRAEIEKFPGRILFHKIAIQPGRPFLFARFTQGTTLIGIPGNPVSGVVALRFFIEAYLRELQERPPERFFRARLLEDTDKPPGLTQLAKAHLTIDDEGARVRVSKKQLSHMVRPLIGEANAWAILSAESARLTAGTMVDVAPLHSMSEDWRSP